MSENQGAADSLLGTLEIISGGAFSSVGFNDHEGLPLIRIRDLGKKTTEIRYRGSFDPAYLINFGDLLIGMDGDFAVQKWEGETSLLNQRVCKVVAVNNKIDQGFLYWYLKPHIDDIHRKTPQTTVRHLSTKSIFQISAPPVSCNEQVVVAGILDTLDTAIRETEAIIDKLKAVKQGLLHDLLTRGIDASGELRPPQCEAPHLYKQSPLGWIPKEWETSDLDDVSMRGSGHTPSKTVASYWNGGVKWVSLADSHRLDCIFISETDKQISAQGLANSSAVVHPAGAVILSRDAGVGKSAVLAEDMAVSQHFMAWRCSEQLNNLFLYFYLQREKPRLEAIAMGSTVKTIGLQFFKSFAIRLPARMEQDHIADVLMNAEQNLASHVAELAKFRQQKIGLMDDLLTGRVRVTPLLKSGGKL